MCVDLCRAGAAVVAAGGVVRMSFVDRRVCLYYDSGLRVAWLEGLGWLAAAMLPACHQQSSLVFVHACGLLAGVVWELWGTPVRLACL
jgi:hypothetical protein